MKRFYAQEIQEKINHLNLDMGDTVFIHSSLLSFGLIKDDKMSNLPQLFYDALRNKIGDTGTIVVPTFNFDFCEGKAYDRQNTPSKNMGVFSEFIRLQKKSIRSYHPTQSVAAIGKHKEYITQNDTESPFAINGPFDRLMQLNTKVLLLGIGFCYNSVAHLLEERLQVPYRYWKIFNGTYINHGVEQNKSYKMYVRDLTLNSDITLAHFKPIVDQEKLIQKVHLGSGEIQLYKLQPFMNLLQQKLQQNPYFLIRNHKDCSK